MLVSFAQQIVVFTGLIGQKTELRCKRVEEGFKIGECAGADVACFRSRSQRINGCRPLLRAISNAATILNIMQLV